MEVGHRGQSGKIDGGSRKARQRQGGNSSSNANGAGWNDNTLFSFGAY